MSMKICKQLNNEMQFDIKNFILERNFRQVMRNRRNDKKKPFKCFLFVAQTPDSFSTGSVANSESESEHRLMTINEIINGSVIYQYS